MTRQKPSTRSRKKKAEQKLRRRTRRKAHLRRADNAGKMDQFQHMDGAECTYFRRA